MSGSDYDEDEPEFFRPVPHPDDRLWRHPSEVAAMHAANASAETTKVPVVEISQTPPRSRFHNGLMVTAGLVAVGAVALTIGVVSSPSDAPVAVAEQAVVFSQERSARSQPIAAPADPASGAPLESNGLTERIHDQVAPSLPRIQAVTSQGMQEGSGLFVTDDGHIATSAQLIDNAEYIVAWTDDGQRWRAELIASDSVSDVAVIQIEGEDWPAVALGSGTDLLAGQHALALDHDVDAVSAGTVMSASAPMVEIDQPAAVPGSAIVDDTGAVIAMVAGDGSNRFATRAWVLERVAIDLIASGATSHNFLGLVVTTESNGEMVLVEDVIVGSPADEAGLLPGDLIDSVDGAAVVDAASLYRLVQNAEVGQDIVLTVTSDGTRRIQLATPVQLTNE